MTGIEALSWLKIVGVKILTWVPGMIFEKWIYPDVVFKEHIEVRVTCEGIYVHKGQPGRVSVPLEIINLSPYLDIFIESMKVYVGSFVDLELYGEVVPKLKITRFMFDGIISSEQEQSIRVAKNITINCNMKFSRNRNMDTVQKGFSFQGVTINGNC